MTSDNTHDKVLDHTRLQLSALFDGELALDEARFLQRRLQHDAGLAGCVSRWQLAGDILRGQATAAAPAGFAGRVADAIAADAMRKPEAASQRSRWAWGSGAWGPGAALAASVAVVALFMARQSPEGLPADTAAPVEMASTVPARPALAPDRTPAPSTPQVPDTAAQLAAATVAVAEVPRRAAARRASSSRGQAQRAAATRASREIEDAATPQLAVASGAGSGTVNPFAPETAAPVAPRPWPRALLPNAGAAFNVGYGSLQAGIQPPGQVFGPIAAHPFRPRPAALQPEAAQQEDSIPSPR